MNPLRERIFAPRPVRTRAVDMPEWGGTVYVRALSVAETERMDAKILGPDSDKGSMIVDMAIATACDESGAPIFTAADADALAALPAAEMRRLYQAGAKFNKFMPDPEGDAGKAGGGASATPAANTSSGPPNASAG